MEQSQAGGNQSRQIALDREYLRSWFGGIFRLVECGLNLLVIITASINLVWLYYPLGGGWLEFVGVVGLVATAVVFFLHLFNVVPRLPAWWPLFEFCFALTMTVFYVIAFIVAAVRSTQLDASVGVCAAFAFIAMIAYAFDSYQTGTAWRSAVSRAQSSASGQPSAVVVTNTYDVARQAQAPPQPASYGAPSLDFDYGGSAAHA